MEKLESMDDRKDDGSYDKKKEELKVLLSELRRSGALGELSVLSQHLVGRALKMAGFPLPERITSKEFMESLNLTFSAHVGTRLRPQLQGVTILEDQDEAEAIRALWFLFKQGLVKRLRKCRLCDSLFYARFKHQQFCNDSSKGCQQKHWRKQNPGKNAQYQTSYRLRLFGKPRRYRRKSKQR
jgi:hypothetical protein